MSLDALQGIWCAQPGKLDHIFVHGTACLSTPSRLVWVKDKRVFLDSKEACVGFENKGNGIIMWGIAGSEKLRATGSSLRIVWKQGAEDVMIWEPSARGCQR